MPLFISTGMVSTYSCIVCLFFQTALRGPFCTSYNETDPVPALRGLSPRQGETASEKDHNPTTCAPMHACTDNAEDASKKHTTIKQDVQKYRVKAFPDSETMGKFRVAGLEGQAVGGNAVNVVLSCCCLSPSSYSEVRLCWKPGAQQ